MMIAMVTLTTIDRIPLNNYTASTCYCPMTLIASCWLRIGWSEIGLYAKILSKSLTGSGQESRQGEQHSVQQILCDVEILCDIQYDILYTLHDVLYTLLMYCTHF